MSHDELEPHLRRALGELFPEPDDVHLSVRGRRPRTVTSRRALAVAAAVLVAGGAVTLAALRSPTRPHSAAATVSEPPAPSGPVDLAAVTKNVPCPGVKGKPVSRDELRSFHAVAAMYCFGTRRTFAGDGEWEVRIRYGSATGIGRLQALFELPDRALVPASMIPQGSHLGCATSTLGLPSLQFVDARGRSVLATSPKDTQCGGPLPEVERAFDRQPWRTVSVTKLVQTKTPAELAHNAEAAAAGCSSQWKNEIELLPRFGAHIAASPGGPVLTHQPTALLHVCVYRVDTTGDIGEFDSGRTLEFGDSEILRMALQGAGPTGTCSGQQRFAVVTAGAGGDFVEVELGGCWRVLRHDTHEAFGQADPSRAGPVIGN